MDNLLTQIFFKSWHNQQNVKLEFWERVAIRLFNRIRIGKLEVEFSSGAKLEFGGILPGPTANLKVNDFRFVFLTLVSGDLGFAESYINGYIETQNIVKQTIAHYDQLGGYYLV